MSPFPEYAIAYAREVWAGEPTPPVVITELEPVLPARTEETR